MHGGLQPANDSVVVASDQVHGRPKKHPAAEAGDSARDCALKLASRRQLDQIGLPSSCTSSERCERHPQHLFNLAPSSSLN